MPLLGAVAAALALAAAPPDGFRRSALLTPLASREAGVSATVYCARSRAGWTAVFALTLIERRRTFLVGGLCGTLEARLRGAELPLGRLADAIFTFAHETSHLRGIVGECAADRSAMRRLRRVASDLFGIRGRARLDALVREARASSGYVEGC